MFVSTFNYNKIDDVTLQILLPFNTLFRQTAVAGSLQLDFGNQLVLADQFLIDYAAGIGYGFSTKQHYFSISQLWIHSGFSNHL